MKYNKYIIIIIFSLFTNHFALAQENPKIRTVVIDPGHGGKDSGTIGKYGYEKDLVLDVGLKVGHYIEKYIPDVKVVYTRSTDVFVELRNRAKIANKNNADLFISIHANGVDNPNPNGTETFVMGLDKSDKNFAVVKKENSVILQEDNYQDQYGSFNPNSPESYIALTLFQNAHLSQSLRLAQLVEGQFTKRVGRKSRGVKQAPFWVLWTNKSPSILIELGFISNPEEGKFLSTEQGRDYMASAIYRAFKQYKIEMDGPLLETNNSETTTKETVKPKDNIVFKVQFLSSQKQIPLKAKKFNGLNGVEEYKSGKMYKYTYGSSKSIEEIKKTQTEVRKKYPDAFVVAFNNGEKIPIADALNKIKN